MWLCHTLLENQWKDDQKWVFIKYVHAIYTVVKSMKRRFSKVQKKKNWLILSNSCPTKKLIPGQKISKNWWSFSAKLNQQHLRVKLSPDWWAFNYLIIEISLGNLVQRDSWQTEGFWKAAFVGGRENVETGFSFFGRWLYSCTLSHTYKSLGTWIIAFFSTCNTFLLHFWK